MKVLFVCPFVPWPLVNGGKIRTFNLIRSVAPHAEVHLRSIREPGLTEEASAALDPWCGSFKLFDRQRPGSWIRWSRPKLERWFHSPALQSAVQHEVAEGGYDLVHLDELLLARVVPPGARAVPVVQHHHKLDTVLYDTLNSNRGPHRYFDLWKLNRLEAESARRHRHHLTCSEGDADILRARYGSLDIRAVPSGFDPDFFQPPEPAPARDPLRLLFLGSMNYGPNIDATQRFVAQCMPELRRRHPGVVFEIVGGNPSPDVQALAADDVLVTGRVDDVRPYLARCGQMVVPLRIGGGTRLKIVEALAMGTPVASTSIGAQGLGLRDGHELRLADDVPSLLDAIGALIESPAEGARLAAEGRRSVYERYRWEALAQRLFEYWKHVATGGAASRERA
ncbi:MAG: glycosyltransferase family 4 protein [Planctomycetota bacterium]